MYCPKCGTQINEGAVVPVDSAVRQSAHHHSPKNQRLRIKIIKIIKTLLIQSKLIRKKRKVFSLPSLPYFLSQA